MPIKPLLVLLLMFVPFHGSNGRRLGDIRSDFGKDRLHYYSKGKTNDEKLINPGRVFRECCSAGKTVLMGKNKSQERKLWMNKPSGKLLLESSLRGSKPSSSPLSSSSISWKVTPAREGRREENLGLNLDYLPPKTHPPVHN